MGTPLAFAPPEAVFAEGWRAFGQRYWEGVSVPISWPRLLTTARRLRQLHAERALDEGSEESPPTSERTWDAARVLRHLERSVLAGGVVLRRARFLTILADAVVHYEEAGRARVLRIEDGDIVQRADGSSLSASVPRPRRAWRIRQSTFDGARYDRLRVLTTELRRVLDEGGAASIALPFGTRIERAALARLLACA